MGTGAQVPSGHFGRSSSSIFPEILKPAGAQRGVVHRVLNVLVAEILLNRPRILARSVPQRWSTSLVPLQNEQVNTPGWHRPTSTLQAIPNDSRFSFTCWACHHCDYPLGGLHCAARHSQGRPSIAFSSAHTSWRGTCRPPHCWTHRDGADRIVA
jgi:hypothetical protein